MVFDYADKIGCGSSRRRKGTTSVSVVGIYNPPTKIFCDIILFIVYFWINVLVWFETKETFMQNQKIADNIYNFYHKAEQPNHRYKSWEWCYVYFHNNKESLRAARGNLPDLALLHLGFYLASWGMFRGSTVLLQKDFKIYADLLDELLDEKYDILWCWNDDDISSKNRNIFIMTLLKAVSVVKNILEKISNGRPCSDTLATKILLGIYGCVPAYDDFVKKTLRQLNIQKTVNEKSLNALFDFYYENREIFSKKLPLTNYPDVMYPIMKKIDMALFVIEKS